VSGRSVRVDLAERGYDVLVGEGTLGSLGGEIRARLGDVPGRAFLVADTGLPGETIESASASIEAADFQVTLATLTPTEKDKSIETVHRLLRELAATGQDRSEPVVALGGGIVGDVAGFVAASYRRGVPVVQCPTTLLAMVDASVGGKTGVNLTAEVGGQDRLLKNLVGAFHQPALVMADTWVLDSLDDRFFRAGLAECVKHGLIARTVGADAGLLGWIEESAGAILARDHGVLVELVARNVALKAGVVAGEERESADATAGRALLILGHTFGHAIETIPTLAPTGDADDAPLHHGEAIALGLVAAAAAGEALGETPANIRPRIERVLGALGLPTRVAGLPSSGSIAAAMGHDKKVVGGTLRIIVPGADSTARIVRGPTEDVLFAGIDAIRA